MHAVPNPKATTNTAVSFAVPARALCTAAVIFLSGCDTEKTSAADLPAFDGQKAYAEVEALVQFSPRDAGTSGGWKAAKHIFQRLENFGIDAEMDEFTDITPEGEKTMINVIGMIPGKQKEWIILGSHFDTMPGIDNFQGANDSGSSTGVLLELARMIQTSKVQPDIGLIFAFFDGEEGISDYIPGDGLHGSRHMARQLVQRGDHLKIRAMILLDMVGDHDLKFTLPYNSSRDLVQETFKAAHTLGCRDRFTLSRSIITDDHVPFLDIGIPAIDLIDFKFGSEPGLNDLWHTEADNLQNISAESLEITGNITLQLFKQIAFEQNRE
ncbi:M28 family metallopeptidase [Pontiella agarivorans]|uniref:M28 family metallopeptidase n=1 Tax=Pontiella agarivorans TaxID=3038953 RepID=A0ABU5N205_9BACT|nr:M28 family metallopeptidase [Pontiella agarivorans]MDZ8120478.1 M28 family metallopeptidase [Pontiella agarivorans]